MVATVEDAVKHLLRHLRDARALRKNPLVRHLFAAEGLESPGQLQAALKKVHESIASLIEDMGDDPGLGARAPRYRAILLRCDLGGELHKQIASELGIGIRQFYRERSSARHYVAERLEHKLSLYSAPTQIIDRWTLESARATARRFSGDSAGALSLVRDTVRNCDDPRGKVIAMISAADLLADGGQIARARALLGDARKFCSRTVAAPWESQEECAARIDACDARLSWESGSLARSASLEERNGPRLEALSHDADPFVREFVVEALLGRAWRYLSNGDYETAGNALASARSALGTLSEQAARLRVDILISIGTLDAIRKGDEAAQRHFTDALLISRHNHLPEHALRALIGLSVAQQLRGDTAAARQTLFEHAPAAEAGSSPVNYGPFCLRLAELEATTGNPHQSIKYAAEARKLLGESALGHIVSLLIEAEAAFAAKSYELAVQSALSAEARAARCDNRRMRGTALRVIAESYEALGNRESAREYIESAIDVLERSGHPFSLSRAYRMSARITGSRSHARNAREIASQLSLSSS